MEIMEFFRENEMLLGDILVGVIFVAAAAFWIWVGTLETENT